MSVGGDVVAEYERVYSAAARMLWLEPGGQGRGDWPEERRAAWRALEEVLADDAQVPAGAPGEPSDPTRHMLTRRGPQNRPVPLAEAAQDWWTRIEEGRQFEHPGFVLQDHPEMYGDLVYEPRSCVIVTSAWVMAAAATLTDLERRLAPGRPACVIGEDASELSVTLHEIADHLRGAFTGQGPTPHPGDLPWIAQTPQPFTTRMDLTRLDRLRRVAQPAADCIPSREQRITTGDRSVNHDAIRAAAALRRVLAGEEDSPWQERDPVDPAHDLMNGSLDSFASKNAQFRRELFEESPLPRMPREREIIEPYGRGEPMWKALVPATVFVVSEILDEAAARLMPGRATAMIGYDTQTFSFLVDRINTRLFNL